MVSRVGEEMACEARVLRGGDQMVEDLDRLR